jgi:hypothetical protein
MQAGAQRFPAALASTGTIVRMAEYTIATRNKRLRKTWNAPKRLDSLR